MFKTRCILEKVSDGRQITLTGVISAGRSEQSVLRLREGKPSRYHAEIVTDGNQVFVEDVGSKNGTFVNESRLTANQKIRLKAGDRLRFDIEEYVFRKEQVSTTDAQDPTVQRSGESGTLFQRKERRPQAWIEGINGLNTLWIPAASLPEPATVYQIAQQSVPNATLFILSGEDAGGAFELRADAKASRTWTIGRQNDRDICLDDDGVSASHAILRNNGLTWCVIDDFSRNGAFVNDRKIVKRYLKDQDRISFKPVECLIRLPSSEAGSRATDSREWRRVLLVCAILLALSAVAYIIYRV